jgi:hypothetical protein
MKKIFAIINLMLFLQFTLSVTLNNNGRQLQQVVSQILAQDKINNQPQLMTNGMGFPNSVNSFSIIPLQPSFGGSSSQSLHSFNFSFNDNSPSILFRNVPIYIPQLQNNIAKSNTPITPVTNSQTTTQETISQINNNTGNKIPSIP